MRLSQQKDTVPDGVRIRQALHGDISRRQYDGMNRYWEGAETWPL